MSTERRVTLELRTARDAEHTPAAAAQFFTTLPNPPSGLFHFWKHAPVLTFEILNQGQVTFFFVTVPESMVEYAKGQLTAAYPEILIKELEHDPFIEFRQDPTPPQSAATLKQTGSHYFSLKTYQDFSETDPLSTVLSTLSKTMPGDTILIQFTVRKARNHWKNQAEKYVQLGVKQTDGTYKPHPQKSDIEKKVLETGFQTNIRVLVQSVDSTRAEMLLQSVGQAFHSFDSSLTRMELRKPLIAKYSLIKKILTRSFTKLPNQYFSLSELATMFHLPNKQLSTIKNIAWGKNLLGEPPEDLPFFENIPEEERDNVNLFAKAEYKNQQRIFGIKDVDRRRHMYVIGKSGTGKSTLLANMVINDLKHNKGVAVIDPHGDLIETVLNYVPKHRINDVIVFDPTDTEAVVKLNLFEGGNIVHRELIASGIVAIFQKLYANSWGPRLEYILRNTLLTLLSQNAKLDDILRMLTDVKYRKRVVDELEDPVLKNFWVAEFNTMQDKQRNEAISPILNKVGQFVTSPLVRNVVNTQKSSFSIEEIMDEGKILLVNLSQGKLGEDNTALIGAMLITKIQLAAMNRVYIEEEKRRDFFLYIDEFQNFATTSFIKILSEARKYRLSLTLANQYIDQIPDEIKSAIFGNVGSIASFILGASDSDWMTKEFGNKYTAEDLVSLARYQIIIKLSIDNRLSQPFPAITLGLAKSSNMNKQKVLKVSRERYAKKNEATYDKPPAMPKEEYVEPPKQTEESV
ncbi:MAG: type IV secretion system DNA-binding domain-containing protein [Patescibacteria group bacterium]